MTASALRARIARLLLPPTGGPALVAASPPVPVREVVRRFWPYARPYRRWLWLTFVLAAVGPALETAQIWIFKLVVDDVLVPRDFGPFVWLALMFLGLTLLDGALSFADDILSTWVGERFVLDLRTSCFRHLQGLSLDLLERRRLGDLLSRLTGDVVAIESLALSGVADAVAHVLRIVLFSAALFYLRWDLALVSLVVTPLFWLAARGFSRRIKRASREKRRRTGSITAVAEESLANAALVQAYNRQDYEVERFHRENLGSFAAQMAATRLRALFTPVVDSIEVCGALVVLGIGTWELSRGRLSLGGLLVFLAYLSRLYSPIRRLARLSTTLYSASAGAERIIELLDHEPAVMERPHPLRLRSPVGIVEFDGVSFRYPGAVADALHEVSFAAGPDDTLALVGRTGAGKSTIAKLILRFHDPGAGVVTLDGHDLRELELRSLREAIALLLQETLVFHGSVRENVAYGRPGATDEEVVAAASAAGAHNFVARLPEGYDTVVGERGRRLSGGQRQRIAIARAMIRNAPVLVLDEPTTGLDVESGRNLLEPLRRLMRGRTAIVISHNLLVAREATSILVLDEGRVVERGTHDDLLGRDGLYAALWRTHRGEAADLVLA